MQVDIGVPVTAPVREQVEYVRRAEEVGFAGAAFGEGAGQRYDIFLTMALAASATERISLYSAVVSPVTRHPSVLAAVARSLGETAPGRVKLGLGLGSNALATTGLAPATLADMREAMATIRRQLRDVSPPVPVMLGASGPRMLKLAGELADEVLVEVGPDPKARRQALEHVAGGAKAAGRSPGDVPVTDYLLVSVAEDAGDALRKASRWLAYFLRFGTYRLVLEANGLPPASHLAEAFEGDAPPADLVDRLAVVGTPAQVAGRFEQLAAQGVRRACCMVPGGPRLHRYTLDAMARYVLPVLR